MLLCTFQAAKTTAALPKEDAQNYRYTVKASKRVEHQRLYHLLRLCDYVPKPPLTLNPTPKTQSALRIIEHQRVYHLPRLCGYVPQSHSRYISNPKPNRSLGKLSISVCNTYCVSVHIFLNTLIHIKIAPSRMYVSVCVYDCVCVCVYSCVYVYVCVGV